MQPQITKEIKPASEESKVSNLNFFPRIEFPTTPAKAIDTTIDRAQVLSYIDFPA